MSNKAVHRSIIIEGPIGVGKSSLTHKLADTLNLPTLLEKPAENPFLERFYKTPKQHALPTQLFFLFQRVHQISELKSSGAYIADFMLSKDPLFAGLTLSAEELDLYQNVYTSLSIDAPTPDLMIYLQAPVKVLRQRIKKRNIKFEQKMDTSYLQKLSDAYTDYFHHYTDSPLLIVNAAEFNPIDNVGHYQNLVEQVHNIEAGKHFFNPLAT